MVDRLPPTPFLAIDLPVLQANIERVAAWADRTIDSKRGGSDA